MFSIWSSSAKTLVPVGLLLRNEDVQWYLYCSEMDCLVYADRGIGDYVSLQAHFGLRLC